MEQNVDIPVPGRGGRIYGFQGFLPGQSSTALHGSFQRISERIVEQNVDFPVGGGLQDFLSGQSSSSSSHVPARVSEALDEPVNGFFALLEEVAADHVQWHPPWNGTDGARWPRGVVRLFSGLVAESKSCSGWRVLTGSTLLRSGWSSRCCRLCAEPPVSHRGLGKNFLFHVACLDALFALGNLDFAFALVSFSPAGVWVLPVEYVVFDFSGRVRCLVPQWIQELREAFDEFQHFLRCGELES